MWKGTRFPPQDSGQKLARTCRGVIWGDGRGCLSLSRGTQRPHMRPTGASLKLQGPGDLNAHFEGASLQTKENKKQEQDTKLTVQSPSNWKGHQKHHPLQRPLPQPAQHEACGGARSAPSPGARPGSPAHAPLSSTSPAGHPLRLAWVLPKLTGPDAIVSYLVVRCLPYLFQPPPHCQSLVYAYEGSLLLLRKRQSPEAPGSGGGGGCGFFLVKRRPCASPGSATVWAPWEPGGGGTGGGPGGQGGPGQQPHREKQSQGGDGRDLGRENSGVTLLFPLSVLWLSWHTCIPPAHPLPSCLRGAGGQWAKPWAWAGRVQLLARASIVLPALSFPALLRSGRRCRAPTLQGGRGDPQNRAVLRVLSTSW